MPQDRPVFPAAPRRTADPLPPPKPLDPPRYPENPSPWARLGQWLFDRLTRR
ncbi:hypothetical protein [Methylobacterium sp. Leaf112]|uniref:hypothetical protein n=1 Tax=Methylobacterium sp. Leaf112 TaxID=1736258 RepID=UPI000AEADE70|nr:hypothetical protein [Methylobacterium sp. Leaf112]